MTRRTGSTVMDLGPQLWLAAFGKHPGWNDHMDDLGVETDRLVAVKRAMYVEGISGVIDSGGWESLEGTHRTEGFDHSFVWRHHEGLVVGRMWSSSDGRGRKRYPMMLAVQCGGVAMRFATERVLPRLRQLEDECRAAESAATVISLVDAARDELRSEVEHGARALSDPLPPPAAVTELAEREALGPDREGLLRVLYQLERDFASYRTPERGESGTRSRTMDTRPQQIRVPRVAGTVGEEWSLWMRLVVSQLDPLSPVLMVTNEAATWTDITVGDPGSAQFVSLQASEDAIPLTTSIPYTVDKAFRDKAGELIERGRQGGIVEHDPAHIAVGSDRLAQLARVATGGGGRGEGGGGIPKPVILAAGAGVVLLAGVLAALVFTGGGGGANEEEAEAEAPDVTFSQAEAAALDELDEWCELADAWVLAFVDRAVDFDPGEDQYLAAIVALVQQGADGAGPESFDPVRALGVDDAPGGGRVAFAEAVRNGELSEVISSSRQRSVVDRGLELSKQLGEMLDPDGWPAAQQANTLADELERRGAERAAEMVGETVDALTEGSGRARAEAASAIGSSSVAVGRLLADLRSIDEATEAAAGMSDGEDAVLAGFARLATEVVEDAVSDITGLDRVSFAADRLGPLVGLGSELVTVRSGRWDRVDQELFAADAASRGPAERLSDVRAWLVAVSDPRFLEVDPSADPRPGLTVGTRLTSLGERLGAIATRWTGDAATLTRVESLLSRVRRLERDWDDLSTVPWRNATRADVERRTDELATAAATVRAESDAFVASLAGSIAEYIERQPLTVSVRGNAVVDAAWAEAVESFAGMVDGSDPVELRQRVDAARLTLAALEEAIVRPELPAGTPLVDRAAAVEAVRTLTESGAAEAIEAMAWDGATFEVGVDDPRVAEVIGGLNTRLSAYGEMVASAGDVEDHLARGLSPMVEVETGSAAGLSPVEVATRWRAHEFASDDVGWSAVEGAFGLVDAAAAASDASGEEAAGLVLGGPFPVRLAAWRAMVEDGFGPDADALAGLEAGIGRLRTEAGRFDDDGALQAEIDAGVFAVWQAAALAASDRVSLARVAGLRSGLGIEPGQAEGLDERLAFDLALLDFVSDAQRLDAEDAQDADALARLWTTVEQAGGVAGVDAGTLEDVRTLLNTGGDDAGIESRVDPSEIGPGRLGFAGVWLDAERLEYTGPNGMVLRFGLVEPEDGEPAMLGEHEAPVELLIDYVWAEDALRASVERFLPEPFPASQMVGPRTWVWSGDRPVVASRWLTDKAMAESDISGPGAGPTGRTPITRVSRLAAASIAAAAGCRLPTEGEWQAAYAAAGSPEPGPGTNLRDASFESRRAALSVSGLEDWPDAEVFVVRSEDALEAADAVSHDFDDGALWFRPVDESAGFGDVVGNVAEFIAVYEGAGAAARGDIGPVGEAFGADLEALKRDGGLRMAVIGGSALSPPPPTAPIARPRVMSSRVIRGGYTDVGFRLAFGLDGQSVQRSLAVRVGEAAGSIPLLTIESGD